MADNTDKKRNDASAEEGQAPETLAAGQSAEDAAEKQGFSDPLEFLNAELERVETEKAEYQEQMLRLAADMENLRKRTQKDVADARNYSISGFAREMLAVADNLRRALETVSEETRQGADEAMKSLIDGVELTERSMLQALEKNGVKRISPANERFDPNFHQAMFEIPNKDVPNNTVLEVVQDGFMIGDRVLRPAMVGVAKGGPKVARSDASGKGEAQADEDLETSDRDSREAAG